MQCGADLGVYRLLDNIREEIVVKDEIKPAETKSSQKGSGFLLTLQAIPAIILLICAVFGIFVGLRFLSFLDRAATQQSNISVKWANTGFEQLQQMNSTIKEELDLIIEQRNEIQSLQAKIQQLNNSESALKKTN